MIVVSDTTALSTLYLIGQLEWLLFMIIRQSSLYWTTCDKLAVSGSVKPCSAGYYRSQENKPPDP
jgi:hypothetical protein